MHENDIAFTSHYVSLPNGEQLEPVRSEQLVHQLILLHTALMSDIIISSSVIHHLVVVCSHKPKDASSKHEVGRWHCCQWKQSTYEANGQEMPREPTSKSWACHGYCLLMWPWMVFYSCHEEEDLALEDYSGIGYHGGLCTVSFFGPAFTNSQRSKKIPFSSPLNPTDLFKDWFEMAPMNTKSTKINDINKQHNPLD